MKFMHMLASVGLLAAVTASSFAQVGARPQIYSDVVPPERGTAEIGLAFSANLDKPSSQSLDLKYLPYLNRQVQIGGEFSYDHAGSFSGGFLNLIGNYNFVPNATTDYAINRTIPYVGLAAGISYGDYDGSVWGAQAGVKHFLTNDVSLFAELQWRDFSDTDDDNTRLLVGINTYLR